MFQNKVLYCMNSDESSFRACHLAKSLHTWNSFKKIFFRLINIVILFNHHLSIPYFIFIFSLFHSHIFIYNYVSCNTRREITSIKTILLSGEWIYLCLYTLLVCVMVYCSEDISNSHSCWIRLKMHVNNITIISKKKECILQWIIKKYV